MAAPVQLEVRLKRARLFDGTPVLAVWVYLDDQKVYQRICRRHAEVGRALHEALNDHAAAFLADGRP